jgi:TraY domain
MDGDLQSTTCNEVTMVVEHQTKRVQISIHLDEPLREQLEAAAKRSIRSLSGEAAYRIRQSLEREQSAA